jgi:hypothetical protein
VSVLVNGVHYCVRHDYEGPTPCGACADDEARAAFAIESPRVAADELARLRDENQRLREVLECCATDIGVLPDCVAHDDCDCTAHRATRLLRELGWLHEKEATR